MPPRLEWERLLCFPTHLFLMYIVTCIAFYFLYCFCFLSFCFVFVGLPFQTEFLETKTDVSMSLSQGRCYVWLINLSVDPRHVED